MKKSNQKIKSIAKSIAGFTFATLFFIPLLTFGQRTDTGSTQSIRGTITDDASGEPISFATISLTDIKDLGATSGSDGKFHIDYVPIGRHSVKVSFLGYEPAIIKEIMVSSAKEVFLDITLKESVQALDEVVVRPHINKEQPLNKMVATGARMFSVEEASRYAGGVDDPGRLVSSFAGVSADGMSNGISIHGNVKAVNKALAYHCLLMNEEKNNLETTEDGFFFVKSERRYFKINFDEVLFIEGLKDYIIIQTNSQRIITKMTLKIVSTFLPPKNFFRVNKSYIINTQKRTSFDNNDVYIQSYEIAIGSSYREALFEEFVNRLIK